LGKMSAWIIGILVSTAMIAALVGIGSAAVFDLNAEQIEAGQSETEQGTVLEDRLGEVEELSTPEKILNFITANIFLDMKGELPTSVIAVVIFAAIVDIAVLGLRRKNHEQAATFTKINHSISGVAMSLVKVMMS